MAAASPRATGSKTTVNLAAAASSSSGGKRVQTTDDILRAIESTMPTAAQSVRNADANFSARMQGRINEHELAFGDMSLPRGQRLPKVDNALLDRYQAARQNVLVLGAIQQMAAATAGSKPGTHRSGRRGARAQGSNSQGRLTAAAALANAHAGTVAPATAAAARANSRRGSRAASEYDDGDDDEQGSDGGPGLPRLGLSSAWSSFKSSAKRGGGGHHASAAQDGGPGTLSREPSGGLDAEASYGTTTRSRASRRYNWQASNNSMASRASLSASACGSYASGSAVSSSGTGRRLGRASSHVSSSSSGHTLRSHRTADGSTRRKGGKKKPPKPRPGCVTLVFAEFGAREDWVSQTLLKHALASIIQARWRGYHTRQRWKADKQQLVEDEQARLCAAETQAARLQDMQHKLALYQQKQLAQAAADAAAEEGGSPEAAAAAASHWPAPSSAVSRATSAARRRGEGGPGAFSTWQSGKAEASFHPGWGADGCCDGSDSDSGWSDVEVEDVAAIKCRAVTPPWQRVAEHQQMSQQLRQRTAAAAAAALGEPLDAAADWGADPLGGMLSLWSSTSSENTAKLDELRRRRISRKPEPVPLSAPAAAAAAAAGLLAAGAVDAADEAGAPAGGGGADAHAAAESGDEGGAAGASSSAPLSADAVERLLLERYHTKFARLGVPHKMPGRQRWRLLQQAQAQADAAAQAAGDADDAAGVAPGFEC